MDKKNGKMAETVRVMCWKPGMERGEMCSASHSHSNASPHAASSWHASCHAVPASLWCQESHMSPVGLNCSSLRLAWHRPHLWGGSAAKRMPHGWSQGTLITCMVMKTLSPPPPAQVLLPHVSIPEMCPTWEQRMSQLGGQRKPLSEIFAMR